MENELILNLEVDKIEDKLNNKTQCKLQLFWGKNKKVSSELISYPFSLINEDKSKNSDYYQWRRLYKQYYQQLSEIEKLTQENQQDENKVNIQKLEKKIAKKRKNLQQSESILLNNFNNWLNNDKRLSPLYEAIIQEINKIDTNSTNDNNNHNQANLKSKHFAIKVNIFITCNCRELERLPWEKWQLKRISNFNFFKTRIIRSPSDIHSASAKLRNKPARILAIFGDSTGLNFNKENQLLSSVNSLVKKLEIISWDENKYKSIAQWRSKICDTIADTQGWDMLFFFGHSDENSSTGGTLGIAPNQSISIKDITPYLIKAQNKGLQFALFNSCNGIDIGHSLIDLGFNQVIIMREPIHNSLAQDFFQAFLTGLAKEKNVSDVLYETCEILNPNTTISNSNSEISKQKINYPSAYLIPSLFGHPDASFYQLKPFGWKAKLKEWLPNRQQTLAITFLSLISLFPSVQEFLLDKRLFTQAIYRDFTQQIPDNSSPPIVLISIDEESLRKANISQQNPLDRKYLARIIDNLTSINAQNISIDYLLDLPQVENDPILAKSIQNAIKENGTSFIFASITEGEKEIGILPDIASLNTVIQGSIEVSSNYSIPLPDNCYQSCPFTYLTAVNQRLWETDINNLNFSLEKDYKTQLLNSFYQTSDKSSELNFPKQVKILPITEISQYFWQYWLQPIVDYSLPPSKIYQIKPAWQLLENNDKFVKNKIIINNQELLENEISFTNEEFLNNEANLTKKELLGNKISLTEEELLENEASLTYQKMLENKISLTEEESLENQLTLTNQESLKNQVILIASGGYKEAGIDHSQDFFSLPLATQFWQKVYGQDRDKKVTVMNNNITGGEVNAYMIHHWLTQHLIIPLPDLWLILVAGLLAKSMEKYLSSSSNNGKNLIIKLSNKNFNINILNLLITVNLIYICLTLQFYITLNLILPIILPSLSFWIYFLLRSNDYENL